MERSSLRTSSSMLREAERKSSRSCCASSEVVLVVPLGVVAIVACVFMMEGEGIETDG